MKALEAVQWGMIGVGDVTRKKSAPSFNKIEHSRLVAVAGRTPGKAKAYAAQNGIDRWFEDPMDLIADPEVNAVYIATPPGSHMEYALKVIEAGKPVYIEKPMARTYRECMIINEAAEKNGVPVFVAYYRRSLEYFLKVKEILDSGSLGQILTLHTDQHFPARPDDFNRDQLPWRVIPEISGGGYFHDMGCHTLDIIFYLFGDPLSVKGSKANLGKLYGPEDTITAELTLPGRHEYDAPVLMTGNWSFVVPEARAKDRVYVTGDRGSLLFSIFSFEPVILEIGGEQKTIGTEQPLHIQMPHIRSIVAELRGAGRCPSTGMSASVTSRVMEEVVK
ncbi:MAG: Gfo/Idh/MocA family oxidoreductase [Bacteroidales bacterium]|nr:Gfo/Idh/MocA family oxidoreductase [Bacteroidales bacterium]